jgi:hypothetical protein
MGVSLSETNGTSMAWNTRNPYGLYMRSITLAGLALVSRKISAKLFMVGMGYRHLQPTWNRRIQSNGCSILGRRLQGRRWSGTCLPSAIKS